jgi:hypothetical protein
MRASYRLVVEKKDEISRRLPLEIFLPPVIFSSCLSTSFIANNARATAKSSCVPAIGRGPGARIVVQRNCPRNFPCSPRPVRVAVLRHRGVPVAVVVVAVAAIAMAGID